MCPCFPLHFFPTLITPSLLPLSFQDVIKTRIQRRDFNDKTSGTRILADLVKNEGFGAFFKGLTPKLIVIGPKLVFSFTIAQQLMSFFEKRF
jgi:hypothetical protein